MTLLPPDAPRIVALGDSITSGHGIGEDRAFPAALQQRLLQAGYAYRVMNAGVSRDTTGHALQRLPHALAGDVRVVIVALGANDGLRGIPVAQVKANLGRIIVEAQGRRSTVLLCAMEALPIYGWEYTRAFRAMYEELATEFRVTLVPFVMLDVLGRRERLLPDQIHPNAAGAETIAEHIWPYLQPLLRRIA